MFIYLWKDVLIGEGRTFSGSKIAESEEDARQNMARSLDKLDITDEDREIILKAPFTDVIRLVGGDESDLAKIEKYGIRFE